jgi:hypothetical protein
VSRRVRFTDLVAALVRVATKVCPLRCSESESETETETETETDSESESTAGAGAGAADRGRTGAC